MKNARTALKNTFTALCTPFDLDDDLAKDVFRTFVQRQIKAGVGLVPVGTTGESPTLSHEEHHNVIRWCVEESKKSAEKPFVLAGVGSNSTDEAIDLSDFAKDLGVDGLLHVCPYYNKPTQKGLIEHYSAIARKVDLPIVIYNIPGRTGVNMLPETTAYLASKFDNIVGYKAAEGKLDQIQQVIEKCPKDFVVMSGDDNLTMDVMKLGGKGAISVASNVIPERIQRFTELMTAKKWDEAKQENDKLQDFFKTLFVETNPVPCKYMLGLLGVMLPSVRLPLVSLEPESRKKVKECLVKLGLLTQEQADKQP